MALARRPLRFEQLEDKRLLAGDVTVAVVHGALVITGDELGNQIAISSGAEPGEYLIQGLDGTVLHLAGEDGAGESELLVTGVRHGIHVALQEGDDAVSLTDARVHGNVVIDTGAGEDHVSVGLAPAATTDLLLAETIADDSNDLAGGVAIGGSLVIRTGEHNDTVHLGGQDEGNPELSEFSTDGNSIRPSLRVGRNLVIGLGDGEDHLALNAAHVGVATVVNGGQDADWINLSHARTKVLTLLGGGGEFNDAVSLNHVYADVAGIGTGQGSDQVEIVDSAFGILGVRTGGGDDTLAIGNTRARLAILLGGEGSQDTWNDLGGNQFGHQIVLGFELPSASEQQEPPVGIEPIQAVSGPVIASGQGISSRLANRLRAR
jgi:hypothetical protein